MNRRRLWTVLVVGVLAATGAVSAGSSPAVAASGSADDAVMVSSTGRRVAAGQLGALDPGAAARLAEAQQGAGRPAKAASGSRTLKPPPAKPSEPGAPSPAYIIDGESRTKVALNNVFPNSAIALLNFSGGGSCTGFLVSPDTVLTAAHCLFNPTSQTWSGYGFVYPGRQGSDWPFGLCGSGEFWVPNEWVTNGGQPNDFGALKLDCEVGRDTGWFALFSNTNVSLVNKVATVTGYPGVTPNGEPHGTMWQDTNRIRGHNYYTLYFNMDATGGQSGGPIFGNGFASSGSCRYTCVAGIVTDNGVPDNVGVRLNTQNMGHINYWISLP